jgi:hypothetical protein
MRCRPMARRRTARRNAARCRRVRSRRLDTLRWARLRIVLEMRHLQNQNIFIHGDIVLVVSHVRIRSNWLRASTSIVIISATTTAMQRTGWCLTTTSFSILLRPSGRATSSRRPQRCLFGSSEVATNPWPNFVIHISPSKHRVFEIGNPITRDGILRGKDDFRVSKLIRFLGQARFNIRGKPLVTRKYDVHGVSAGISVFGTSCKSTLLRPEPQR